MNETATRRGGGVFVLTVRDNRNESTTRLWLQSRGKTKSQNRTAGFPVLPKCSGAVGSVLVFASWPEHDGCGECDGGEEGLRAPVVASGDPAPILQASGHDLDPVAAFVAALIVLDGLATRLPARNAGLYPFVFQSFSEPACITARSAKSHSAEGGLPRSAAAPV